MIHVKLYRQGEGCFVSDGGDYLMVLAKQVDSDGNWLATGVQPFKTWQELRNELRTMVASGEGIIIRASAHFERLANELGLPMLASEWGKK